MYPLSEHRIIVQLGPHLNRFREPIRQVGKTFMKADWILAKSCAGGEIYHRSSSLWRQPSAHPVFDSKATSFMKSPNWWHLNFPGPTLFRCNLCHLAENILRDESSLKLDLELGELELSGTSDQQLV